jgi:anti-sigma-K factor RskA
MNIRHNIILRQKLAAEYVLGTLRGGARRRFEGWMHQDADLRNITAQWQQRLAPMAEFAGSVQPPNRVWTGIERRLNLKKKPGALQFWLYENIAFWRSLGLVSTGLAALLMVVLLTQQPEAPSISYLATLSDDKAQAAVVLTADSRSRALDVRVINSAAVAADKSLQLWAVPKDGAGPPRSLGVLAGNRGRFVLSDKAIGADVALLAISLEPKGGSPNPNAPSGPIIYTGKWVQL